MSENTPNSFDRERMRDAALFVPRLLKLMGRLIKDAEVPTVDKILLGAALLYAASPVDLVPDSVPVVGQLDDLYLLALCLLRLLNRSGEAKLRQHWDGPEDIIQILQSVTDLATRYLPVSVRGKIKTWVEAKSKAEPEQSV